MKKSRLLPLLFLAALPLIGLFAADPAAKSAGYRFPGGDAMAGRESFIGLNCVQCHSIEKVDLPDPKGNRDRKSVV